MRRPIIAGNWKMNMTPSEARALVEELKPLVKDAKCEVVVCPPYVDLSAVSELIKDSNIRLGAQNIHWAEKGAFTGEVSANMLKELGVEYAIIGHSERRQYFGETDETVNARAKAAIAAGITPIICVGESLEERESGRTEAKVSGQVKKDLEGIAAGDVAKLVIAYLGHRYRQDRHRRAGKRNHRHDKGDRSRHVRQGNRRSPSNTVWRKHEALQRKEPHGNARNRRRPYRRRQP